MRHEMLESSHGLHMLQRPKFSFAFNCIQLEKQESKWVRGYSRCLIKGVYFFRLCSVFFCLEVSQ